MVTPGLPILPGRSEPPPRARPRSARASHDAPLKPRRLENRIDDGLDKLDMLPNVRFQKIFF